MPSVRRSWDRGSLGHPIRPDVHSRARGGTQMTKGSRLALTILLIAIAALSFAAGPAAAQGQTIKIGLLYDHTGPVLGRRLAQLLARRQDDDRLHQREGRRPRQVQDRPGGRRQPVQGRGGHQRGRAAAQRREGRHPGRRLLERARRARSPRRSTSRRSSSGSPRRSRTRSSKDRNLQYTFRPQTNGGLFGVALGAATSPSYAQEKLKKAAKDAADRHHLRGRALRRRRGRRQRGRGQAARACRSCSRKATRSARPISPRW